MLTITFEDDKIPLVADDEGKLQEQFGWRRGGGTTGE